MTLIYLRQNVNHTVVGELFGVSADTSENVFHEVIPILQKLFPSQKWEAEKNELANGESWENIQEREADKLIDVVNAYAPNFKNSIIDRFVQSPLDLEQRLGLLRGNVMHVEMDFDQMFLFRPLPEMSQYKTPIKNLYLTGASTHPGGGVFAASGYNTAQVVLKDVKGSWW